jgi:hypothetical protein
MRNAARVEVTIKVIAGWFHTKFHDVILTVSDSIVE